MAMMDAAISHRPVRLALTSLALGTLLAAASPALAALGGPAAGIGKEVAQMHARVASRALPGYSRADITRANGGMVHEFANADGQVFAVTWQGPGKPDLRRLLGTHFGAVSEPRTAQNGTMRPMRHPLFVNRADLKIEMTGHMGWFRGVAYIPSLVPAGFALSTLDPAG